MWNSTYFSGDLLRNVECISQSNSLWGCWILNNITVIIQGHHKSRKNTQRTQGGNDP